MAIILISTWIGYPIAFSLAGTEHFRLRHEYFWFSLGLAQLWQAVCFDVIASICSASSSRATSKSNGSDCDSERSLSLGATSFLHRWTADAHGCGLALANWMSALVLFVTSGAGYLYRVHVEEKALVGGLGEPYRDYMRRTKMFVPYVI
jgi:hypothetical protein